MPSLQSLRRKIAAFKNTQKITKAMKMVAAAKLKRSQDRILAARPYALKMRGVLSNLSRRVNRSSHPLLQKREGKKVEVLVVTSDRGLCGGFNGNIVRKSSEFVRECEARGLQVNLSDHFVKGTFDELYIVYNEFKSAIQQRVIVEKLFPVDAAAEFGTAQADGTTGGSYLYEPDEADLLNVFIPKHFQTQTFRILLESAAAEHGARMSAMDGATRNAGQLIMKVTLHYNKTRQTAITKELMDIVGGAEALK